MSNIQSRSTGGWIITNVLLDEPSECHRKTSISMCDGAKMKWTLSFQKFYKSTTSAP